MSEKGMENNKVSVIGTIVSDFTFSHAVFGEGFYLLDLSVSRLSEQADVIPLMISERLIDVTRESFDRAMAVALSGNRVGDIGHAVEEHVKAAGYTVVRQYVGHGVGAELHEEPEIPNYGTPGRGARLLPGMTIAVEPMVNAGGAGIKVMPDGWTVKTADGRLSAHYENTILITDGEPELLTDPEAKAE